MNAQPVTTILIADDHPLLRHGLRLLIETVSEFKFVGEATDGNELIELAMKLKPDIILTDIQMPFLDGIKATRHLTDNLPGTDVIAISMANEETIIRKMLQAGAKGYLLKEGPGAEVITAIHAVRNGNNYFSKAITNNLTKMVVSGNDSVHKQPIPAFSEKEIKIIKLISEEYSTKQIADELSTTKRAVDGLRDQILKKTNAKNTAGLVVYAIKNKIIDC